MKVRDSWGVSWPACGCPEPDRLHETLSEVLACRARRKKEKLDG